MSGFGSHPMCSLALARQQSSGSLLSKGLWKESCPGKASNMDTNGRRALTSNLSSDSTRKTPPKLDRNRDHICVTHTANPHLQGFCGGSKTPTHFTPGRKQKQQGQCLPHGLQTVLAWGIHQCAIKPCLLLVGTERDSYL